MDINNLKTAIQIIQSSESPEMEKDLKIIIYTYSRAPLTTAS